MLKPFVTLVASGHESKPDAYRQHHCICIGKYFDTQTWGEDSASCHAQSFVRLVAHCCRGWTAEEKAEWEQVDRLEQAELADHANAPTTLQEHTLPGADGKICCRLFPQPPPPPSVESHICNARLRDVWYTS